MKVHVFAPNIVHVIASTFYWFEAGQNLVRSRSNYFYRTDNANCGDLFGSIAIELLCSRRTKTACMKGYYLNMYTKQKQWCIKIIIYTYICLFSASSIIMPYGKLITRFKTGAYVGSRYMLFPGQVMKISYPPVVQRVITTYLHCDWR